MFAWVWLACATDGPGAGGSPPPEPARHALVLIVDTLRRDAVVRADAPAYDALVAAGDEVPHAWSAGTWTVPSVISMFSGRSVREHGWDEPPARLGRYPRLPDVPLLAEVLAEAGFATAGVYANPYLAEQIGFDRGFDTWTRLPDAAIPGRVRELVAGWDDGRRHFLYVHLLGPHSTLKPSAAAAARWRVPAEFLTDPRGLDVGAVKRARRPGIRDAYFAAYHAVVEDTDARVAEIVAALGPHADDTAIVFTSDHGELIGEHDAAGHGREVWQELTHVPLVAVRAGALPDTLGTASVADLVTTAVGVDHDWPVRRDHALPLVSQREGRLALSPDGRLKGVWRGEGVAVYDLAADPGEATPLPDRAATLDAARAAWEATTPAGRAGAATAELPAATRRELEALGYVTAGEPPTSAP